LLTPFPTLQALHYDFLSGLQAGVLIPFPSLQALHYDFLSGFKPVFYLRQRGYSKSVPVAPFVVNYDGALFRTYPAGWQVCIKCSLKFIESGQMFTEPGQMFTESGQMFTESGQLFTESGKCSLNHVKSSLNAP
jgi:hypothetical protein